MQKLVDEEASLLGGEKAPVARSRATLVAVVWAASVVFASVEIKRTLVRAPKVFIIILGRPRIEGILIFRARGCPLEPYMTQT